MVVCFFSSGLPVYGSNFHGFSSPVYGSNRGICCCTASCAVLLFFVGGAAHAVGALTSAAAFTHRLIATPADTEATFDVDDAIRGFVDDQNALWTTPR